jgi:hypothetical protein
MSKAPGEIGSATLLQWPRCRYTRWLRDDHNHIVIAGKSASERRNESDRCGGRPTHASIHDRIEDDFYLCARHAAGWTPLWNAKPKAPQLLVTWDQLYAKARHRGEADKLVTFTCGGLALLSRATLDELILCPQIPTAVSASAWHIVHGFFRRAS